MKTYKITIRITLQDLIDRVYAVLGIYNNFISYNEVNTVDQVIYGVVDSLKAIKLENNVNKSSYNNCIKSIIDMLENIETDDDYFPTYHIESLRKLIIK